MTSLKHALVAVAFLIPVVASAADLNPPLYPEAPPVVRFQAPPPIVQRRVVKQPLYEEEVIAPRVVRRPPPVIIEDDFATVYEPPAMYGRAVPRFGGWGERRFVDGGYRNDWRARARRGWEAGATGTAGCIKEGRCPQHRDPKWD
jgi:hypothetical protein